jgi:hypothetical protein
MPTVLFPVLRHRVCWEVSNKFSEEYIVFNISNDIHTTEVLQRCFKVAQL